MAADDAAASSVAMPALPIRDTPMINPVVGRRHPANSS
jgi:hypothetical protein